MLEFHFTDDRDGKTFRDHKVSLTAAEVRALCGDLDQLEMLLGDGVGSVVSKPDGAMVSDSPIRAVANGWELDARGAIGGVVYLRGRRENPADLARGGAPIPIVAGDYGIVQYTPTFSVFVRAFGAVPFNPGVNRIFVRFVDGDGITRGATSVAVRTP